MDEIANKIRSIYQKTGWGRSKITRHLRERGENVAPATVGRRLRDLKKEAPRGTTVVSLTDWHYPFEDKAAIKAAFAFCEKVQPEVIIVHEIHDFYALSKFDKDPSREQGLQDEIDQAVTALKELRELCPFSQIILLESNHLDRLRRYLWSNAKALAGLRALKLENLLELQELNISILEHYEIGGILFKHGDIVRKNSGYTARGEFEKEGTSGLSGHTHRLGSYYRTQRGGSYVWIECGCLCDLRPEYISGVPDWQHGFGVVQFEPNGSQYYAQSVPIINGKILWGGEIIG